MTNIFSIMVIPKDNDFDRTLNHKKMTYNCTYLDTNKPPHTQPDGLYMYRFFMDVIILGGHIFCTFREILFEQFMMKGS